MSLLTEIYKITEPTTADIPNSALLLFPLNKFFSLDLNNISINDNNGSILWNFGDPFSIENEIYQTQITNASTTHVYTHSGTYKLNVIVNLNGTLFHITKDVIIPDDNEILFLDVQIIP